MAGHKEVQPHTKETLFRDTEVLLRMVGEVEEVCRVLRIEIEGIQTYVDRLDDSEAEGDQEALWDQFEAGRQQAMDSVDEWHRPPGH